MRYRLTDVTLTGDLSLTDEIALMRHTVQHLLTMMDQQTELHQKIAIGSLVREAIDQLSKVIERAARLPPAQSMELTSVVNLLTGIQEAIDQQLPDGPAKHQLIMNVKGRIEGISTREAPSALILRTCEMMDRSIPYVEGDSSNDS